MPQYSEQQRGSRHGQTCPACGAQFPDYQFDDDAYSGESSRGSRRGGEFGQSGYRTQGRSGYPRETAQDWDPSQFGRQGWRGQRGSYGGGAPDETESGWPSSYETGRGQGEYGSGYSQGSYSRQGSFGMSGDGGQRGYGRERGEGFRNPEGPWQRDGGSEGYGRAYRSDYGSRGMSSYGSGYGGSERPEFGGAGWSQHGQYGQYGRPSWQRSGQGGVSQQRRNRGPKGYTRSDERIREDLSDRLMQGDIDPSDVEIDVKSGVVTLRGTVCSRDDKYEIEELAENIGGVKDVKVELRIKRPDEEAGGSESEFATAGAGSSQGSRQTSGGTTSTSGNRSGGSQSQSYRS